MLTFDSVKLRLEREQPLSFLEFNYMVLQAYDFLELARRRDCVLQMGGSDQWGNIVAGCELARRVDGRSLFGLTTPLITTASGAKMGKTAAGAVWLSADMLSPYDYWQFWRNTEDADVGRFLRLFTELPLAEIDRLERLEGAEINDAKVVLADEATRLCHGEAARAGCGGNGAARPLPTRAPERRCRPSRSAATNWPAGIAGVRTVPPRRARCVGRRGPPADQGRRSAAQQRRCWPRRRGPSAWPTRIRPAC